MVSTSADVRLVNAFDRPFENAVATARTCYSGRGVVATDEVSSPADLPSEQRTRRGALRDRIARSIFEAGHHTTLQHAHFQFAISGVSRQFLWSFLHSHPFYNSEQVSQRYVEVKAERFVVPPLEGPALHVFQRRLGEQMEEYRTLIERLVPICERAYFERFPSRAPRPKGDSDAGDKFAERRTRYAGQVRKRAQELARYVLPVATEAYLYHTVSGITLLRYWRLAETYDAPWEQRAVVGRMVALLLEHDPLFEQLLQEPLPLSETPEFAFFAGSGLGEAESGARHDAWSREFDAGLDGRVSRLVDSHRRNEECVAQAVRDVLGVPRTALSDDEAIELVLDPARNTWLGETMNVTTLSKLSRALHHASYVFRKRLSHTADSQDQRHRMTPASRPCLTASLPESPDVLTPALICEDEAAHRAYRESIGRTWDALAKLKDLGVGNEYRAYLLPNAVAIRFTESSDLLHLHHKLKMRLCYNAQEEIWRASLDEADQVAAVDPRLGRFLRPPCSLRHRAGRTPYCPEGDRYCGVPVWRLEPKEYERGI